MLIACTALTATAQNAPKTDKTIENNDVVGGSSAGGNQGGEVKRQPGNSTVATSH
ncbi:MAG: hypothetical protein J6I72_02460 [Muribaculaceae bacterium]|nr:hypothetical protein [Muribaculaceae bacterium]